MSFSASQHTRRGPSAPRAARTRGRLRPDPRVRALRRHRAGCRVPRRRSPAPRRWRGGRPARCVTWPRLRGPERIDAGLVGVAAVQVVPRPFAVVVARAREHAWISIARRGDTTTPPPGRTSRGAPSNPRSSACTTRPSPVSSRRRRTARSRTDGPSTRGRRARSGASADARATRATSRSSAAVPRQPART